ncbi:16S rRNA (cytidine(1402)-2'-O)-methyltransferase [Salinisphaera sp. PC39]|uniref:16S rRNA (cytidine(1402)-2'-O)-methyltransferase n=1 Tax=Salinisphaera sp. PC39 TaxID=1304156 RepID=UPI00333F71B3
MQGGGVLHIVATPIGNLGDLAPRVRDTLAGVDLIAAEDTRRCAQLLGHLGIAGVPAVSLHEHNESERVPEIIERLRTGGEVALVSDAGTPLVSDPGFLLVRAAREAGLTVRVVPGPCAAVAALAVSGLPPDRFVFEGFLPSRATARRRRLGELAVETRTLVLYESSHRIADTVADIAATLGGDRSVCLARELTKLHEESVTLTAAGLGEWLAADDNRHRGEFVLVVGGTETPPARYEVDLDRLLSVLLEHMPAKAVARTAAELIGVARNEAYERILKIKEGNHRGAEGTE